MAPWLVGLVMLGLACVTDGASGFWISGKRLQGAVDNWERLSPPATRETIRKLKRDRTSLVHIKEGKIDNPDSRGAASTVAMGDPIELGCDTHPDSSNIDGRRNWDVIYDRRLQEAKEQELKLPSPVEALLHHEIIGHIVPALEDPKIIDEARKSKARREQLEEEARQRENEYRSAVGLPPVPARLGDAR